MYQEQEIKTKKLVIAGLLLALGFILPMVFHVTGLGGKVLLPMHIPVLIGGFLLPPQLAIILGISTPLLSSLLTGMPELFPMGLIMMFELGAYGLATSIFYRKKKLPMLVSLVLSMIIGRLVAGLAVFVIASMFEIPFKPVGFVVTSVTTGLPGLIIQIILIPSLIYFIEKYTTINFD